MRPSCGCTLITDGGEASPETLPLEPIKGGEGVSGTVHVHGGGLFGQLIGRQQTNKR